jgi:hypothetical protein
VKKAGRRTALWRTDKCVRAGDTSGRRAHPWRRELPVSKIPENRMFLPEMDVRCGGVLANDKENLGCSTTAKPAALGKSYRRVTGERALPRAGRPR